MACRAELNYFYHKVSDIDLFGQLCSYIWSNVLSDMCASPNCSVRARPWVPSKPLVCLSNENEGSVRTKNPKHMSLPFSKNKTDSHKVNQSLLKQCLHFHSLF